MLVKLNIFKMYEAPDRERWDYYYVWSFCDQIMRMTETTAKVISPERSECLCISQEKVDVPFVYAGSSKQSHAPPSVFG